MIKEKDRIIGKKGFWEWISVNLYSNEETIEVYVTRASARKAMRNSRYNIDYINGNISKWLVP